MYHNTRMDSLDYDPQPVVNVVVHIYELVGYFPMTSRTENTSVLISFYNINIYFLMAKVILNFLFFNFHFIVTTNHTSAGKSALNLSVL
jgi:hypothetical protein